MSSKYMKDGTLASKQGKLMVNLVERDKVTIHKWPWSFRVTS